VPTTLAQLRTQAQARADFENDSNVSTAAWASFLNGSRQRLRRLLVDANPQLFLLSKAFTLTSPSYTYDLLANAPTFWKALSLDYLTTGASPDDYIEVPRFMWAERNRALDRAYRVYGNTLEVRPQRLAAGSYTLWYVEAPTALAVDGDAITLAEDMYSEFIVLEAAIKARRRQQKDSNDLTQELEEMIIDVRRSAGDNDVGAPDRVIDSDASPSFWRPRLPNP
jgi:hypothetical protein